ncbi:cytochrome P450 4C1 [Bicyclus anynana]|uniref:Cytochrome P450 4C1 n=1 Tax=Bicyclus anynana TaxID=110368 RepID=A0ABM3M0V4_BICAN|nr:cytochrome P450 4C1 [Bicyclus anynana]
MLTTVLGLIFLAGCVIAWRWRNSNNDEPVVINGYFPIIGHAHVLFVADYIQYWVYFLESTWESMKAGGVARCFIGPRTVYNISDPDDFMTVANNCLDRDYFYQFAKPWLGEGLVTSNRVVWTEHRKLLDAACHQNVLDGFLDVFNRQARRLVEELQLEVGRGPFDAFTYTRRNALETSCLTIFGVDPKDKCLSYDNYIEGMEQMFSIIEYRAHRPWLHLDCIYNWSPMKRKEEKCLKTLHQFSSTILKKKKAEYLENRSDKNNEERLNGQKLNSFMELFIELAMENGTFNEQEIREHVDTLMFSGHDMIASVLLYTVLLVGSCPNVQNKVFEELDNIFTNDDRDVTKQDLSQMTYLDAVIKESMRIYPVVPFVTRHIDKNTKLKNCTLSKGASCVLSIYGANRHSVWGPYAERFKPERWMDPSSSPEYAFASFGVGRRTCLGKSYSLMCLKTTLAHIFRSYRVSGDHNQMLAKLDIMLRPVSGHHVSIEMRK